MQGLGLHLFHEYLVGFFESAARIVIDIMIMNLALLKVMKFVRAKKALWTGAHYAPFHLDSMRD